MPADGIIDLCIEWRAGGASVGFTVRMGPNDTKELVHENWGMQRSSSTKPTFLSFPGKTPWLVTGRPSVSIVGARSLPQPARTQRTDGMTAQTPSPPRLRYPRRLPVGVRQ